MGTLPGVYTPVITFFPAVQGKQIAPQVKKVAEEEDVPITRESNCRVCRNIKHSYFLELTEHVICSVQFLRMLREAFHVSYWLLSKYMPIESDYCQKFYFLQGFSKMHQLTNDIKINI
jgi:hypothetical protein